MKGTKDAYVCRTCSSVIISLQREDGIVPVEINCRAPNCRGRMFSERGDSSVPLGETLSKALQRIHADFQWVRPPRSELRAMRRAGNISAIRFHAQGGLSLYPWPRDLETEGQQAAFSRDWKELMTALRSRRAPPPVSVEGST